MEITGLEKIIKSISDVINDSFEDHAENYDIDPGNLENLLECSKLCDKLLDYDYFSNSESYLDSKDKDEYRTWKAFTKVIDKWQGLYTKDLRNKRKDLKKLFNLIIEISEEI